MKTQRLSKEEEIWLKKLVGNADPDDHLCVQRFPDGYTVELKSSSADLISSLPKKLPPLKIKPTPCLTFNEVIGEVARLLAELSS